MTAHFKMLDGYPAPGPNGKYTAIAELIGPTSYNSTTGQRIYASQFGMGGIEFFDVGDFSLSRDYIVKAAFPDTTENQGPASEVDLFWYHSNGTACSDSDNLSAEIIKSRLVLV